MDENSLAKQVVEAALEVHRVLGAGLLESVYRQALERELDLRELTYCSEVPLSAEYKGLVRRCLSAGYGRWRKTDSGVEGHRTVAGRS